MTVFWALLIMVLIVQFLPFQSKSAGKNRLILSLFFIFLYGSSRVNYGLDYQAYLDFFDDVKAYGFSAIDRMEFGYYYLNKCLPSFRSLLVVQSAFICTSFYYLFKWYIPSKFYWLGFLLLFLCGPLTIIFMLSGIRNGIALSFFILSTYFIYKRKLVPFAMLIFIAYWFHNSVVLFAPLAYLIANGKAITKKSIVIWFVIMVFLTVASNTVILDYMNIFITTYFDRYSTYVILAEESGKGAGVLIIIFSFIATILLLLNVKEKLMTAKENMIIKLTMLFFLAFLLGPLNARMSQYFVPFFIAGSVMVIHKSTNKNFKSAYIVLIFVYLLYALKIWSDSPNFNHEIYESIF